MAEVREEIALYTKTRKEENIRCMSGYFSSSYGISNN
jgi:hypothetical protein